MKNLIYPIVMLTLYIFLFFPGCSSNGVPDDFNLEDYRVEPRPTSGISEFSSDFEAANLEALFPIDLSGWTNLQLVETNGNKAYSVAGDIAFAGTNSIELQNDEYHSGLKAFKFAAPPTGSFVSKAAIQKGGAFFESGDDLWVSVWFFIEGTDNYQSLFLLDIETSEYQGSPGRRLMMSGGDNVLKLESKSDLSGSEYRQSEPVIPFSKNEWVHIVLHMRLSAGQQGLTEIWQNDVKIIDQSGQNLPTESTVYNRFQFGITANSSSGNKVMYVDDVVISKNPL